MRENSNVASIIDRESIYIFINFWKICKETPYKTSFFVKKTPFKFFFVKKHLLIDFLLKKKP